MQKVNVASGGSAEDGKVGEKHAFFGASMCMVAHLCAKTSILVSLVLTVWQCLPKKQHLCLVFHCFVCHFGGETTIFDYTPSHVIHHQTRRRTGARDRPC